jgi:alkanesulfonate monooxygenase SsuD/methylene tetrahydromethanopterin reductase-like flavin-dependent oxidoreductase (luciferase family)
MGGGEKGTGLMPAGPRFGYLLPTRERIMQGAPGTGPMLDLAARAEQSGFDSIWVGDSLLARPRHEPLTLLAGVAGRVPGLTLGTAVLLPALRNPVLLAHAAATLDQLCEGRLILGVGIAADVANIRAEFAAAGVPWDKRVGRMMEGLRLCQALWRGEPVDWDGRWQMQAATLAPVPHRPGGPLLWIGGNLPASLERAGRHLDGWFPISPTPADFATQWQQVRSIAGSAGRDPHALTGAMYLTLTLGDDQAAADARLDAFLAGYYGAPAAALRRRQAHYAGPAKGLADWFAAYHAAGAGHLVLRFAGDAAGHLAQIQQIRQSLGWS